MPRNIQYSDRYSDDNYEYRHVILPPEIASLLPPDRLLSEDEWRALGVCQSPGWVHYYVHKTSSSAMSLCKSYDFPS